MVQDIKSTFEKFYNFASVAARLPLWKFRLFARLFLFGQMRRAFHGLAAAFCPTGQGGLLYRKMVWFVEWDKKIATQN